MMMIMTKTGPPGGLHGGGLFHPRNESDGFVEIGHATCACLFDLRVHVWHTHDRLDHSLMLQCVVTRILA
jgi:hypothetical protein